VSLPALHAARIGAIAAVVLTAAPRLPAQIQTAAQTARMTCGSVSNTQQTCRTNASIVSARLERDLNGKRCREGTTWGYTNSYIWTNSGCRGDFLVNYQAGTVSSGTGIGVNGNVSAGTTQTIHCGDVHGARVQCNAGGYISSARIVRQQLIGTCKPNNTWGYTDTYVWTEKMCIADFEVTYSGQTSGTYNQNGTYSNGTIQSGTLGTRVISCGAGYGKNGNGNNANGNNGNNGNGNGRNNAGNTFTCNAGGRIADARLVRADNANRCRLGNTWGYSGRQIWTKNGCRGDFEVTYAAARNR
jgi:hypothetical protein